MSFDLALYIKKNTSYSVEEMREYSMNHFSCEFHPDFSFDDLPDLFQWKISSKVMNHQDAKTFYQGSFEIYPMTLQTHPDLFDLVELSSDHGYLLCCYEGGDLIAAALFASYFTSKGSLLISCENEEPISDPEMFIHILAKKLENEDFMPEEFVEWQ